jgi:hypothetical protein
MIRNDSTSVQRRCRVNVRADVKPSPVGPAIVNEVWPSPPRPMPANDGPFLMKIVVCTALANVVICSTCVECMIAV